MAAPLAESVKGQGVYAYDIDGKQYIDCTSQSWALHLGYSHPEINLAIKEQMDLSVHFHTGFYTIPRYLLARKIAEIFPSKMNRVMFTIGGGATIEAALKVAILNNPSAHNFISLYGGYHGTSFMTTGIAYRHFAYGKYGGPAGSFLPEFYKSPAHIISDPILRPAADDNDEVDRKCLEALEMQIKYGSTGPVCAVLMSHYRHPAGNLYFQKIFQVSGISAQK